MPDRTPQSIQITITGGDQYNGERIELLKRLCDLSTEPDVASVDIKIGDLMKGTAKITAE